MTRVGTAARAPLPARAKWFFAVTAILISACFLARRPGVRLETWQKWLLVHLFELRPDGKLRFRTVVIEVARQNGKSLVAQVICLKTS